MILKTDILPGKGADNPGQMVPVTSFFNGTISSFSRLSNIVDAAVRNNLIKVNLMRRKCYGAVFM